MFELLPKSWVTHPAVNSNDLLAESPSFAGIADNSQHGYSHRYAHQLCQPDFGIPHPSITHRQLNVGFITSAFKHPLSHRFNC